MDSGYYFEACILPTISGIELFMLILLGFSDGVVVRNVTANWGEKSARIAMWRSSLGSRRRRDSSP
jgi:hypothetical protein